MACSNYREVIVRLWSAFSLLVRLHGNFSTAVIIFWSNDHHMLSPHNNTTTIVLWTSPGLPRWAGTRRNIHTPPSWSSSNLYQLLPSTTIHSILPVQIARLAIFLHNLSPCPFWSMSWSGALHLIW